jgi:hypothetical protein
LPRARAERRPDHAEGALAPGRYCFAINESDVRRELDESGTSTAAERIATLVKADRCACAFKNPQGTCCLGNVNTVVKSLLTEIVPAR